MNFNVFRATHSRKGKSTYKYGQSIKHVISTANFADLEQLVCDNFHTILKSTPPHEYHYFLMNESWTSLFCEKRETAFRRLTTVSEFQVVINDFPEIAFDAYDFLLKGCVKNSLSQDLLEEIYIPDDILIPMSKLEKSNQYRYVPQVKIWIEEILNATNTYEEFYDAIGVLKENFNIPSNIIDPIVNKLLKTEVDS